MGSFIVLRHALFASTIIGLLTGAMDTRVWAAPSCVTPPSGLVGWWKGESSTTDSAGTNNGTTPFGIAYSSGRVGQAFSFNATSRRVSVPDNSSFILTNALTIEGWINITGDGGFILFRGDTRSGADPYALTLGASGYISFHIGSESDYKNLDVAIPYNQWKHVAATFEGSSGDMKVYIDGVLAGQANTSLRPVGALDPAYDPAIGIGNHGGTSYNFPFNGLIDEISLYSRALSPSEIQAIYNADEAGKCPPPATAPLIVSHPASQTVAVGGSAAFSVTATGTAPLSYQWRFNGTNIAGATNTALSLGNVQLSQAGNYAVLVANAVNSILSSNAVLSVTSPVPTCVSAPSGLVSWWPGENNAADSVGGNFGSLSNGVTFVPGEVGQAFKLDGTSGYVRVNASSSLNVGLGNGLTMEAWIKPANLTVAQPLIEFSDGSNLGVQLWISEPWFGGQGGPGDLFANITDISGGTHALVSLPGVLNTNSFQHVAVTYNKTSGLGVLYVNGSVVYSYNLGTFTPRTGLDLYLGFRPPTAQYSSIYNGLIDEVSLYSRALSQSEIQGIVNAGTAGKCVPPATAPLIVSQPANQTVTVGGSAAFSVTATGTAPLSYQWRFNGTNIAGATNTTLSLGNVQLSQAGNYGVLVSNSVNFVLSSNALLAVVPLSSNCVAPPSGLVGWWKGESSTTDSAGTNNGTTPFGIAYSSGRVGQAFSFNATSRRVSVPDNSSFILTNALTIEGWINITGDGGFILFRGDTRSGADPYALTLGASGYISFHIGSESDYKNLDVAIPYNQWKHVAATFEGSSGDMKVYIDGVLAGQANTSLRPVGALDPAYDPAIGIGNHGGTSYNFPFNGLIDEISLYSRALSPSEIQAIYNADEAGKCPPPATAPLIVSHPASQTVAVGGSAAFSVTATGTAPLSYQWRFNGTNIAGATNTALSLGNVQLSQAGNYAVLVANAVNSILSSNAVLSVTSPVPTCVSAPSGLVSWWKAEDNAFDSAGSNLGTAYGGLSFTNGRVGSAFRFNGTTAHVRIPDSPSLHFTNALTIEAWVSPTSHGSYHDVINKWDLVGSGQKSYVMGLYPDGRAYLTVCADGNDGFATVVTTTNAVPLNQWTYLAATFDGASLRIYVNGVYQAQVAYLHLIFPGTHDLGIGGTVGGAAPGQVGFPFAGLIDEPAIYGRALSAAEILSVYTAGANGKCVTPTAPVIVSQPANQTVTVGGTAAFSVVANGTAPLSYQWSLNGTNIAGATNTALSLGNVQLSQAGNYAVLVSNSVNFVLSTNALLTVVPLSSNCVAPPSGLVSWWKAEDNAFDSAGSNLGTAYGGLSFTNGRVGSAFRFNGTTAHVRIPDSPSLHFTNALTIEAWVSPTSHGSYHDVINKWDLVGSGQKSYVMGLYPDGRAYLTVCADGNDGFATVVTTTNAVPLNQWTYLAATFDGASLRIYVNGVYQAQVAYLHLIFPGTHDLGIGGTVGGAAPGQVGFPFAGLIDEPAIYGRALSAAEILSVYTAGANGKCVTPTAPVIVSQPANQTVTVGGTAAFSVVANGTAPLSYQWSLNGTNIAGATNTALSLGNVQLSQAGNYAVLVSNSVNFVLSTNALLTVVPLSSNCVAPPSGLVSWWKAESNALEVINANSGVLRNGVVFAPGKVGQAFSFNGSSAYVEVSDSPSLQFTNAMTIEAWLHPDAVSTHFQTLVSKWDGGPHSFTLKILPTGTVTLGANSGNTYGIVDIYSVDNLPVDQWTHLAVTYNGVELRLYFNAVLQSSVPWTHGILPGSAPLTIGSSSSSGIYYGFDGLMDELSLYSRALSQSEIQGIVNAGTAGKCPPPATAPLIVSQPASQTVAVGGSAAFSVTATGTAPLSYQWRFNGTNIAGATNTSLSLGNVQLSQAGNYGVLVSNSVNFVLSSNALLTVVPLSSKCVAPPSGLVGWWKAEGNASDSAGSNLGTAYGGLSFTNGKVGTAFSFNGTTAHVRVPDSTSLHFTNALTIEAWVYPTSHGSYHDMFNKWDLVGSSQKSYDMALHPDGRAYLTVCADGNDGFATAVLTTNALPLNQWTHLAATYDGAFLRIYVNGAYQAQVAYSHGIFPGTHDLGIGGTVGGGAPGQVGFPFAGLIDEPAFYSRALTQPEVLTIYNAGSAGKCVNPTEPVIVSQPASQSVIVGGSAAFSITATGTAPLSYQWRFNGTNIPGATTTALSLSNVQLSQTGNYAVLVSNSVNFVLSSNAVLTVSPGNALVAVVGTNAAPGSSISVPIVLVANGNENALGFSLNLNVSMLNFVDVVLGSGAPGATLLVNTNLTDSGKVGLAISLPTGSTFAAGTQQIAVVNFSTAFVTNGGFAVITFEDQPVLRQVSDAPGNALPATFASGTVSIVPMQFEGDVSPRPDGNRSVTITDWVLVGRYAARLDYPTNASEFQRADCAPRSTLGNGQITVSDWVQGGRYAAGLDPLTPLGGPTSESGFASNVAGKSPASGTNLRQLSIPDALLMQGQTATFPVILTAQGDENAMGFSINFDPAVLAFESATLGSSATEASLNVNVNQAASGQVGLVLALPTGKAFAGGSQETARLTFRTAPGATGTASLAFGDQPVTREVSDQYADTLGANFLGAALTINPSPSLKIAISGQNLTLAWPLWATNFTVQEASGDLSAWSNLSVSVDVTNGNNTVVLPITNTASFYRLHR